MLQDVVDGGCGPNGNAVAQFVKAQEQLTRAREDAQELLPTEEEKVRLRNRASVFGRQLAEKEAPVGESLQATAEELQADPETRRMFDEFMRATEHPDFLQEYAARHAPPAAAAGELALDHFAGPGFHGLLAQFPYNFTQANPFLALPTPYEDALKLYQEGELRDAILAFEAEVQRNPHSSEAWRWLGTAHAENDEDKLAIASLLRAVDADPEHLGALLDLGVSFTNELAQSHALRYLKMWIEKHPQYAVIAEKIRFDEGDFTWMGFHNMHMKVTQLFHMAEEMNKADPDVYTVLGVLYNLSREFDRAEDCFKRALDLDANNYSLWNKLGATQANGTKNNGSSEAVYAYRHALELKPNYVRAWVNMGISYANQNKHLTAAKYYAKALRQNENAEHIWSYLRIACTALGREDLIMKVDARDVKVLVEFS